MLSMIVAMGDRDFVIGLDGDMPWKLSADLKRFKKITTGHPVIMGRKTWESIPPKFRPLPNRRNIVLSSNEDYEAEGAEVFTSIGEALSDVDVDEEAFLIGGAAVFKTGLSVCDRLYLTEVAYDGPGDTYFPEDPAIKFVPTCQGDMVTPDVVPADEKNTHRSRFWVWERRGTS